MKNSPIGFFDSGVGGLSVYARFRAALPAENTIYFGDLKNLPYGNKSKEELIRFARGILDFFESKKVKAVVIACNTSSAIAYESVKNDYTFKIYPIIQSCSKVIASMGYNRIGVFATEGTVKSGAYQQEINKYNKEIKVSEIACPNWVNIVEGVHTANSIEDVKLHVLEMRQFNPEKIILGCTHYPYLINILKMFAPEEIFIDPARIFVDYIKNDLELNPAAGKGYEEFYVSAQPKAFVKNARLFYEVKQLPVIYSAN